MAQNWLQNKISVQKSQGLRHPSASSILSTSKIPETLITSYPSQEPSTSPSPTRPQQLSHYLSLLHVHTLLFFFFFFLLWNIWNICQSRWNLQKSWYTYHLALTIITKWPCYFIYAHTPLPPSCSTLNPIPVIISSIKIPVHFFERYGLFLNNSAIVMPQNQGIIIFNTVIYSLSFVLFINGIQTYLYIQICIYVFISIYLYVSLLSIYLSRDRCIGVDRIHINRFYMCNIICMHACVSCSIIFDSLWPHGL